MSPGANESFLHRVLRQVRLPKEQASDRVQAITGGCREDFKGLVVAIFWRPVNAIRSLEDDGNSATVADPTWTPLINAPYPEHPSGHLCLDGAHLGVLDMFLGTDDVSFGVTSIPFPGEIRPFDSFSQALDEIVEARIWAGLHFRTANVQARALGRNVADYMASNYFQPVGR